MKIKKKFGVCAVALCSLVVCGFGVMYATCPKRAVKEALCSEAPALCRCYENVVDYRMNRRDVAITNRYQKEMKKAGFVSPLEFASLEEVQRLNILLGICRAEQMQKYVAGQAPVQKVQPVQQPVPQQVQKTTNDKK